MKFSPSAVAVLPIVALFATSIRPTLAFAPNHYHAAQATASPRTTDASTLLPTPTSTSSLTLTDANGAQRRRRRRRPRGSCPDTALSATLFSVSSNHVVDKTTGEIRESSSGVGVDNGSASAAAVLERTDDNVYDDNDVKNVIANGSKPIPNMSEGESGERKTSTVVNGVKMIHSAASKAIKGRSITAARGPTERSEGGMDDGSERINGANGNSTSRGKREKGMATGSTSFASRVESSGAASVAAMATAAVNAAVAMKTLEAPDVAKSYISLDRSSKALDEDGLPLAYDKDLIEAYWRKERGALNRRWSYFVSKAVPFLTKMVSLFIAEGKIDERHIPGLSRQARIDLQDLGPTFIKAGQMMSVRPDVLPQPTLDELTKLQDSVVPFDTGIAVEQIESELGGPLGQFFTSISEEPVAAASLAQVYLATLNDGNNTKVAVKVQRPDVLSTVSKDLYVLRRAAEVFQGLVERFAPQQKTNYVALLNEWAIGFYTELDFANEARNQRTLREALERNGVKGVTVPRVYDELCTRRILVSEWMDGQKLSDCTKEEIAVITDMCQEAFLVQLFEEGFFHADPHPGNILKLHQPTEEGHTVALIDCGLMARIEQKDRDNMISAVIHLANKDYASLVDDFINLNILPPDSDRAAIIPLMDKALSPYVKGGGAKKYEEELRKLYGMEDTTNMQSQVGGFQAMTQDALTVLNDVPFSIPPYFAILGRAIVTLEGIALTGNPDYGIIMESYPFIARKLLREDRPEIQRALQEVLYSGGGAGDMGGKLKFTRLLALLNNAAGSVGTQEGAAFVDLDAIPDDGLEFSEGLKFLLSDRAESLRRLLEDEVDAIVDVISRQILRRGLTEAVVALSPPRPPSIPFLGNVFPSPPKIDDIPLPFLLPPRNGGGSNAPSVALLTVKDLTDLLAPSLTQDEEIYAIGLAEAAGEFFGQDVAEFVRGDGVLSVRSARLVLGAIRSGLLGRGGADLLDDANVRSVLRAVGSLVDGLGGSNAGEGRSVDEVLATAVSSLDESERARLDDIVSELVRRSIARATERLSSVPRAL